MFLNFKFSIFKAYKTSLETNYKHLFFYISWYFIVWLLSLAAFFVLGVYTHILNVSAMTQNYSWIISLLKNQLISFFVGVDYSVKKLTEFSFYGFLKVLVSEDILNHALSTMSLKEYFKVVVLAHKFILVPMFILFLSFMMTISIGYIKSALQFQSGQKATLHDMYHYMYLLPQYFLGKIIMFLLLVITVFFMVLLGFITLGAFGFITLGALRLDQTKGFALAGIAVIIILLVIFTFVAYIYQRLRFMKYFIIDKEVSAFKACKLSWNITKGAVISLSLFSLVTILVGVMHPISGLFIMLALLLNQQAEVSVYRQMIEEK